MKYIVKFLREGINKYLSWAHSPAAKTTRLHRVDGGSIPPGPISFLKNRKERKPCKNISK